MDSAAATSLAGRAIAIPETRQLDVLARLLERRGATVLKVPLIAIYDVPNREPVLQWIQRFISSTPTYFVILTGEGLSRLLALADKNALKDDFIQALSRARTLCRGPKPERVLRSLGMRANIKALAPTTDGVIETLKNLTLEGLKVGVQLYGQDPNVKLMNYLASRRADVDQVAPYIYADESEADQVVDLIRYLNRGEIDVITFTSQPQYHRLVQVARKHELELELSIGLQKVCVAAVGPVVKNQLKADGHTVAIMPGKAFFMKPLVTEIMRYFRQE